MMAMCLGICSFETGKSFIHAFYHRKLIKFKKTRPTKSIADERGETGKNVQKVS
jgi:hypothetical protein